MSETFLNDRITLHSGDSRDVLRWIPDNTFDSIVTDPPYALTSIVKRFGADGAAKAKGGKTGAYARASAGFMGQKWDTGEVAFDPAFWADCMRVLKPGGHVVAFGASRGYHRMACAIEDAGFEIRDSLMWMYSTGFPKSHQVDRLRGDLICGCETEPEAKCEMRSMRCEDVSQAEHSPDQRGEVLQPSLPKRRTSTAGRTKSTNNVGSGESGVEGRSVPSRTKRKLRLDEVHSMPDRPTVDGEKRWLCDGTQSNNGEALPIHSDANGMCSSLGSQPKEQLADEPRTLAGQPQSQNGGAWENCGRCGKPMVTRGLGTALKPAFEPIVLARKPLSESTVAANVLRWGTGAINVDGCRIGHEKRFQKITNNNVFAVSGAGVEQEQFRKSEIEKEYTGRWPANILHDGSDEVVDAFPDTTSGSGNKNTANRDNGTTIGNGLGAGTGNGIGGDSGSAARFFYSAKADSDDRLGSKHPTVKPVDLMQWLVRLVTPKNGLVLDPFAGTGTTGEAAFREGMRCALIEREVSFQADIRRRMGLVLGGPEERRRAVLKEKARDKPQDHGPLFG